MLCRKNITLTCASPGNAEENLRRQLNTAKEEMIFCFVIECMTDINLTFTNAKQLGLLESEYRWFSLHHFDLGNSKDLPQNLISIELNKLGNSWKDAAGQVNIHFLGDALTLVAKIKENFDQDTGRYTATR